MNKNEISIKTKKRKNDKVNKNILEIDNYHEEITKIIKKKNKSKNIMLDICHNYA